VAHPVIDWFFKMFRYRKNTDSVRETITELIQESPEDGSSLNNEERTLLSNVLRLRDVTVDDVKIPRADMIAISVDIKFSELIKLISATPFTRLPVYQNMLDDLLGYIHVKDIVLHAQDSDFDIRNIIQQVLFVPPSMRLLDLLLQMRSTQIPMAYVVPGILFVKFSATCRMIIRPKFPRRSHLSQMVPMFWMLAFRSKIWKKALVKF
jgi:magnesium and cobalt transporter